MTHAPHATSSTRHAPKLLAERTHGSNGFVPHLTTRTFAASFVDRSILLFSQRRHGYLSLFFKYIAFDVSLSHILSYGTCAPPCAWQVAQPSCLTYHPGYGTYRLRTLCTFFSPDPHTSVLFENIVPFTGETRLFCAVISLLSFFFTLVTPSCPRRRTHEPTRHPLPVHEFFVVFVILVIKHLGATYPREDPLHRQCPCSQVPDPTADAESTTPSSATTTIPKWVRTAPGEIAHVSKVCEMQEPPASELLGKSQSWRKCRSTGRTAHLTALQSRHVYESEAPLVPMGAWWHQVNNADSPRERVEHHST